MMAQVSVYVVQKKNDNKHIVKKTTTPPGLAISNITRAAS